MIRIEGVFVALVTPFLENGHLSTKDYEKHLEYLEKAKVQGLVPCGTTGEGPVLTADERKYLIQEAVRFAHAHKLRVIAGCGSNNTVQALEYCQDAARWGADAALLVTPYYNRPTAEGVVRHYLHIADRSPIPVVLYNVPSRTNVSLSVESVVKLMEHPNIIGIKEASGSFSQWLGISESVNLNRKSLLAGDDDAFAAILSLNGSGIISATANLVPRPFVDMYEAAQNKRWDEVYRIQKSLYLLVRAMFSETNPAPLKYALETLDRMPGNLRLPLSRITSKTEETVRFALAHSKAFL